MSVEERGAESVIKEVPLDRLAEPEHDVRSGRDPDELRSLAQSMDVDGQLQPALCYIEEDLLPDDVAKVETADIEKLVEAAEGVRVVDGWSRRLAAGMNEWPTLRCEVFREPPAEARLLSLAANTERLEMRSYETMKTLKELVDEADTQISDLAPRVGYHPSTLSTYLGVFEGFEPVLEAWKDPETHVELGHVVEINRCPTPEVAQKVFTDLMSYERSVGYTREVRERAEKDWRRSRNDDRSIQEKQRDGEIEAAQKEAKKGVEAVNDVGVCILTGAPATTQIAVPVSPEARGLLTRLRSADESLAEAEIPGQQPADAPDE